MRTKLSARWLAALLSCLMLGAPLHAIGEIVELPIDFSPGLPVEEKYEVGKMEYDDPSIHVERYYEPIKVTYQDQSATRNYYVVKIRIANATQLRTAAADSFKSRAKDTVEVLARENNAVVAIEGDYYSEHPGSFVLRQGIVYRNSVIKNDQQNTQDILLIDENGDFHAILGEENPGAMDLTEIDGKKVINGFNFGPCIIRDGERLEDAHTRAVSPNNSKPWEPAQRMCLCQTGELEYMIVACTGMPLYPFADLVLSLGDVQTAYMMDGGDSVQIVFLGKKVNSTSAKNIRVVPDCIYFASAYQPD